jgi:hypothetical protein
MHRKPPKAGHCLLGGSRALGGSTESVRRPRNQPFAVFGWTRLTLESARSALGWELLLASGNQERGQQCTLSVMLIDTVACGSRAGVLLEDALGDNYRSGPTASPQERQFRPKSSTTE